MCPRSPPPPKPVVPAAAPAPPLEMAEEPRIGEGRKKENITVRGSKDVSYRRPDEGMKM